MQSGCDPVLLYTADYKVIRLEDEEIIGFEALWESMMKCKRGEISQEKVDESYRCWRECASKGDGYRMLRNMDRYYQSLWEDEEDAENH